MATNWNDLRNDVYTLTNRSELQALTDIALRKAIRTIHSQNKFWRDLVEYEVVPVLSSFDSDTYELDLSSYPRFRDLAYLKPSENTDLDLEIVTPTTMLDLDSFKKQNVVWGLGSALRLRSEFASSSAIFKLGYYSYPQVDFSGGTIEVNDWALDVNKDIFTGLAAMEILGALGDSEIRSALSQMITPQLAQFVADNTVLKG